MHNSDASKIGLGGGCHWCCEGVFTSLVGIKQVKQGWIASSQANTQFSEAVEVYFDASVISLSDLIAIHLHTHASTANHSMRKKYRSAVYTYDDAQDQQVKNILTALASDFDKPLVTQVYRFVDFKINKSELLDYFYKSPNRPFCKTYIHPKLTLLLTRFKHQVDHEKLAGSGVKFASDC